jgi:hypothetical protein
MDLLGAYESDEEEGTEQAAQAPEVRTTTAAAPATQLRLPSAAELLSGDAGHPAGRASVAGGQTHAGKRTATGTTVWQPAPQKCALPPCSASLKPPLTRRDSRQNVRRDSHKRDNVHSLAAATTPGTVRQPDFFHVQSSTLCESYSRTLTRCVRAS